MCDALCVPEYIKEQRITNARIEKEMLIQKKLEEKDIKMLLLGTGESGKSTILKQMLLIHGAGYSTEEKLNFKPIIFRNIIQAMNAIIEHMNVAQIPLADASLEKHLAHIKSLNNCKPNELSSNTIKAVISLWADKGVSQCYTRAREFQLNDSAKYYFTQLFRIGDPEYIPSEQDILRSRVQTTGITETLFRVKNLTYRMFDVAGQRSERRKWIHCFDNVTAVVFLAAISEFDQVIVEDSTTNRIVEAYNVFKIIFNNKYFVKTSMILFLNKIDLFREKIEKGVRIKDFFPEFEGQQTFDAGSTFFLDKFLSVKTNATDVTRQIYPHFTCATDTSNVRVVMIAVNETLIRQQLGNIGFI